jgi:hypothetical protein
LNKKLSNSKINEAFRLMRLSSEQQRESFRKLTSKEKDTEETYVFIRATIGTKETKTEVEDAGLE